MDYYTAGDTAAAVRQQCATKFAGVKPVAGGNDANVHVYGDTGIIQYSDPDNRADVALSQGGLFDFGRDQTVRILGVRAHPSLGDITVTIGDRDNANHDVIVETPATEIVWFNTPIPVLPSQVVKISSVGFDAAGFVDLYVVKGSWF